MKRNRLSIIAGAIACALGLTSCGLMGNPFGSGGNNPFAPSSSSNPYGGDGSNIEGDFYDRKLLIGDREKIMCWTPGVSYFSSDPKVVTVRPLDDGTSHAEIEAISMGEVTITVSKKGYESRSFRVTVNMGNIEGDFYDRRLSVGETLHINAYTPGVHFESDNPSVAQINDNGDLTAISTGEAWIKATKDGYWDASFRVVVFYGIPEIEGAQYLEFEFAEHLDANGNHAERIEQPESAHGGRSIGFFDAGGREIITFNSDRSGTASMDFFMAWPDGMDLGSSIRIDVNGILLDLVGMWLPDTLDCFNFVPVHFDNVPIKSGSNTLTVEVIGWGGPNMDCIAVSNFDGRIEQIPAPEPLPRIDGDFYDRSLTVGSVAHIDCWTSGVSYDSSDTSIATVSSSGDITGVSAGSVKITISKTGYESVSFTLTVFGAVPEIEGAQYLEFELAEHLDSNGNYVERNEQPESAHGGRSIGFFESGGREIITFNSDRSGTASMDFFMAWPGGMDLESSIRIDVNGNLLNMVGIRLPDTLDYFNFVPIHFDNVAINSGSNTLTVEAIGGGPNMDCIAITNTDASIVQVPAPQSLPRIEGNFYDRTMSIGDTSPIDCWTSGVNYSSSSPSVAYVQEGGLIVAVAAGTTTITISKEGYQDASFNVTVVLPTIDISITWSNRVLVGQTLTINVSTEDVSYSISDESILKAVEYVSGSWLIVEGVSEGDAIVTFSKEGYQDASVQIRAYQIKDIVIESATDVHLTTGETHQIVSSTEGVKFFSGNSNIAAVDSNGLVTALAAGTTKISVSVPGNVEYETAYIYITVIPEGAYLEFESGFHHSDSGSWQSQDGTVLESPVEVNANAHGGLCVSHFDAGCKETLYFSATSAGRGDITILCASSASGSFNQFAKVMLDNYRIFPSASLLDCGDAVFQAVVFNNVAFNEGANELSITLKGGELKLDCAIVTSNDATIAELHEKPETEIQIPEAINPSVEGYSQVAAYDFASGERAANSLTDDSLKSVFNDFSVFEDIVCGVSGTNAMYRGYSNFEHFGLKAGTGSKNGQFTLNLTQAVDRVVVTAIGWTQTDTLKVGDAARVTLAGKYNDPNVAPMDYVFDITPTTSVEFLIEKRCFIQSIRFYSSGAQPVVEENHDLPVVAQGNQPTKIEGAGAWIYLDNSKLGITSENAQSVIDASTFSVSISATENSNDDARAFLETASFGITELRFDDFNAENQTVRLFLTMNYGVSPEWCLEHTFHIKLVIGENTYEGDVRFVANEYIANN